MNLPDFLSSLTNEEREFISGLNCEFQKDEHRNALDSLIERGGNADLKAEVWFPYEVIELGKNWLQDGHEREFVACAAIVLHNIIEGADRMNDVENNLGVVLEHFNDLNCEHQKLLGPLLKLGMEKD